MANNLDQLKQDMHDVAAQRSPLRKSAFLIEALVLFTVLIAAIAIFTSLFASSVQRSVEGHDLEQAVILASNAAEEFAANPTVTPTPGASDDLVAYTTITSEPTPGGVLYSAHIVVNKDGDAVVYELDTKRFVKGAM